MPKDPARVSATMRNTSVFSAKIWKGSRILRFMGGLGLGLGRSAGLLGVGAGPLGVGAGLLGVGAGLLGVGAELLGLADCADHVERALWVVLELVLQNAFAAVERV